MSELEAAAECGRLDRLYSGRSGTYEALTSGGTFKWLPEARAARLAADHGATLEGLDSELFWGDWTPAGVGRSVHAGSLLAALGY